MNLNIVENTKRNLMFGIANKLVAVICPFITRTVIQYTLGGEYLGLSSLFSAVLSMLSLAELGLGTAVVYRMYSPVAKNDVNSVNILLNFYRKAYAAVGAAIFFIGISLMPALPKLIRGPYPQDVDIACLYLVYLINTVISYFMYAYKSSLIVVYQRDDINSRINMIVTVLLTAAQVTMLVHFRSYLLFAFMMPVFTVVSNVRISIAVSRMFPQYHCEGSLPKEIVSDLKKGVSGTVISKMCQVARNSFDSICTSAFMGLEMTAAYNNYYSVIAAVTAFLGIFSISLTGGIGNHVAVRTKDENYQELKLLDFLYMWVSGWCTVCILCLMQPVMRLWMGGKLLLPDGAVILLCLYFYLLKIGDMRSVYMNVKGLWWEQRWRSLAEAGANIVLNIILARFFGIYGIIFATALTIFFINHLWGGQVTFAYYFGKEYIKDYFLYHIRYAAVTLALCIAAWKLCMALPETGLAQAICLRGGVCMVFPNAVYWMLYHGSPCYKKWRQIFFSGSTRQKSVT